MFKNTFAIALIAFTLIIATCVVSQIYASKNDISSAAESPFKEKCYKCHSEEDAYKEWRNSGHAKALDTIRQSTLKQDSCLGCHSAGYMPINARRWGAQRQRPDLNTAQNSVSCSACHRHSSKNKDYLVLSPKYLCVYCHRMDCGCAGRGLIHQSQSEMFLGKGGAGIKKMPSPHVQEMPNRCIECHLAKNKREGIAKKGGHTFTADATTCAKCHENIDTTLTAKKAVIYELLKRTEGLLQGVSDKKSRTYKDAKLNYDMVKGDGGCGFHNFKYAKALLEYSISILTENGQTQKAQTAR